MMMMVIIMMEVIRNCNGYNNSYDDYAKGKATTITIIIV